MSAPIIVSQLGDVRESAREKEKRQGLPRTAGPRPLPAVLSVGLSLVAVAGGVVAPIADSKGDLATQVVRAAVVVAFAFAGVTALSRRPSERQPLVVLLGAALGGIVAVSGSLVDAHAHGTAVSATLLSHGIRFGEPLALGAPADSCHACPFRDPGRELPAQPSRRRRRVPRRPGVGPRPLGTAAIAPTWACCY